MALLGIFKKGHAVVWSCGHAVVQSCGRSYPASNGHGFGYSKGHGALPKSCGNIFIPPNDGVNGKKHSFRSGSDFTNFVALQI